MSDEIKRFWRKQTWPNRCTIFAFVWGDWGKLQKTSVMIASDLAQIQTEHLLNIRCRPLLYVNLLDGRGGGRLCRLQTVHCSDDEISEKHDWNKVLTMTTVFWNDTMHASSIFRVQDRGNSSLQMLVSTCNIPSYNQEDYNLNGKKT
jgi:hypothetical protein